MKKFFKKIPFDYRSLPNVFWNHLFVAIAAYVLSFVLGLLFRIFAVDATLSQNYDKVRVVMILFIVLSIVYLLAYVGLVIFVRLVDVNSEEDPKKMVEARRKWTYVFDIAALLISSNAIRIIITCLNVLEKIKEL